MPPSPALRCSPGREPRASNHKRGHSFEGGLIFREKDDDLALFNEMQTRERENFLLQPSDDLEATFCNILFCPLFCFLIIIFPEFRAFILSSGIFGLWVSRSLHDLSSTATQLRHFSDIRLGISIPVRGESSDLLNADGDKNDYDWYVLIS